MYPRKHWIAALILATPSALLAAGPAQAPATVTIRVTDPSRAAVSQAQVRIVPAPASALPSSATDAQGSFAANLKPGSYEIFVMAPGFKTAARCVDVGQAAQQVAVTLSLADTFSPVVMPSDSLSVAINLAGQPVPAPMVFSAADLRALTHTKATLHNPHSNANETYSGVAVTDLLSKAGAAPLKSLHGKALASYLLATGSDGYAVVLAVGELDPTLHGGQILVADSMDGKPLDAKNGPFKLIVTDDKRPARSVHNLISLDLRSAQ